MEMFHEIFSFHLDKVRLDTHLLTLFVLSNYTFSTGNNLLYHICRHLLFFSTNVFLY
jgi:hypothetical protein